MHPRKKLGLATQFSKVFPEDLPEETVHNIIQRPPPDNAALLAFIDELHKSLYVVLTFCHLSGCTDTVHCLTPYFFTIRRPPSWYQNDYRQILSVGMPITDYIDSFLKGKGALSVTSGPIQGQPRVWHRKFGKPAESWLSLPFLDLSSPSATYSKSRDLASTTILDNYRTAVRSFLSWVFLIRFLKVLCGLRISINASVTQYHRHSHSLMFIKGVVKLALWLNSCRCTGAVNCATNVFN